MKWGLTGFNAWLAQRLSALYIAGFLAFIVITLSSQPPLDYVTWRDWVASPAVWTAWWLFFVAVLVHAWVGIRDVILDYVHPMGLRLALLIVLGFGLMALAILAFRALLGVVPS